MSLQQTSVEGMKKLHLDAADTLRRIQAIDELISNTRGNRLKSEVSKEKDLDHLHARKAVMTTKYHDIMKKIFEPIVGAEEQRMEPNAKNVVTIAEDILK